MATTRKATSKELIASPVIFAVKDRETGAFLGFGVPSGSEPGKIHSVTWNAERLCWQCDCVGFAKWHRKCCHIKAVESVCCARKEQAAACPCPCEGACPVVAAPVQAAKPTQLRRWEAWDESSDIPSTPVVPAKREEIAAPFDATAVLREYADVIDETERLQEAPRVEYDIEMDFGYCQPMYRLSGGDWHRFLGEDGHPVVIDGIETCKEWLRIVEETSQVEAALWLEQQCRANAGFVPDGAAAYGEKMREERRRREEAPLNNNNRGFSIERR